MKTVTLLVMLGFVSPETGTAGKNIVIAGSDSNLVLHTYECRIRFEGRVTTTQVRASDAGQARKLAQQQFPKATVLSVKKVN